MRINTKGHMVFESEEEARSYALNAGFTVTRDHASRPDMTSSFTLQRLPKGNHAPDYMWYRPFDTANYPR